MSIVFSQTVTPHDLSNTVKVCSYHPPGTYGRFVSRNLAILTMILCENFSSISTYTAHPGSILKTGALIPICNIPSHPSQVIPFKTSMP